ncbi:MAG: RNA polymerase sigma factor [Planctomycetota bacterium]
MHTTELAVKALVDLRLQGRELSDDQFWVLIERFRADLINQAFLILGSQQDAEDVAQETLCKAFIDLPQLRDPSKLSIWLRQINRFNAISMRRQRIRRKEERLATGAMNALEDEVGDASSPSEEMVMQAVDALPESFREVVVLRYWEKFSTEDIAVRLGIPTGTVRSRLTRADGMLARKLTKLLK